MPDTDLQQRVLKILEPHAKCDAHVLESAGPDTNILEDLKVNSARLVDVVLAFEDEFGIEISDEAADSVNTVGDCVKLIAEIQG